MKAFEIASGIVLLLGAVQCAVIQAGTNQKCDDRLFGKCTQSFADALGWKDFPTNSTAFAGRLGELLEKEGLEGAKKECKALNGLKQCLGDQYSSCISQEYLKSIGVPDQDAAAFVALEKMMTYACTDGWGTVEKNWPCMEKAYKQSKAHLQECVDNLARQIPKDPSKACQYFQEYVECLETPFKNTCDKAVPDFICKMFKVSIESIYPCPIKCSA
jgi:hypothetical protein